MTTTTPVTSPTAAPATGTTGTATNITADFNTFLTLLTTQLRHQDPLNPMNSTEFATQLATFSGVEQQVRTNEQLASILAQSGLTTLAQLGQWVGMEVLTDAPAQFAGSPLVLQGSAAAAADQARLIVRDASGAEVQRTALSLPLGEITWAGVGASGAPMAPGAYSFEVESLQQGQVIATSKLRHYARVAEARQGPTGVTLLLVGGVQAAASSVSGVRRPAE